MRNPIPTKLVGSTGVIAAGESEVTVGGSVRGGVPKAATVAMAGVALASATADVAVKGDVKGNAASKKAGHVAGDGVVVLCLKAQDENETGRQAGHQKALCPAAGPRTDAIRGGALYYFFNQTQVPEDIIIPKLDSTSGQTLVDSLDGYLDGLIAYLKEIGGESVSRKTAKPLHQSFTDIWCS